jgi:quercetin dioxygenase-like cupin family protein
MNTKELEKSIPHITVEIIEYVPNAVVMKTILKKSTGSVSAISADDGEGLSERTSPFDTFVQMIDGKAEIVIDGVCKLVKTGHSIVIPAHKSACIKPNGRFKMLWTVIKSGYEL